jgi:hypothetical protein
MFLPMETLAHTSLKRLSVAWLRRAGFLATACEVRCPIATWLVDVAGWRDRAPSTSQPTSQHITCKPQTVIIECKQSRADFLRDSRRLDALLVLRDRLEGIRSSIEEHRIKALEPQLRVGGGSLFAELEEWDFASSRLQAYHKVLTRLERIDRRVHGETKFFRLAKYTLADALYLAAPRGMIARRELPRGWGLLECDVRSLRGDEGPSGAELIVRVEAPALACSERHRQRMLRNIALAACNRLARDNDQTLIRAPNPKSP